MPVKIYWLHNFDNAAKLGTMARPRGGDSPDDDIINLKNQNVSIPGIRYDAPSEI